MLIASRNKDIIISVKSGIAEKIRIKDLGRARFILGIKIDYDMERKILRMWQRAYTLWIIKKLRQENAKPCLIPLDPGVHLTKDNQAQTEEGTTKMKSKPHGRLKEVLCISHV